MSNVSSSLSSLVWVISRKGRPLTKIGNGSLSAQLASLPTRESAKLGSPEKLGSQLSCLPPGFCHVTGP